MKKNITKSYLFVTELVEEFNSMFHIEKIELKRFDEFKSRDYFKQKKMELFILGHQVK